MRCLSLVHRKIGEDRITHPSDGDGMVTAVSFSQERAYFRNRFVKTKGYLRELKAAKRLYRGFGDLKGGILVRLRCVSLRSWPSILDTRETRVFALCRVNADLDTRIPKGLAVPRGLGLRWGLPAITHRPSLALKEGSSPGMGEKADAATHPMAPLE